MIKPLARFRVKPEIGPCFFSIIVWPDLRSMREAIELDDCYAGCLLARRTIPQPNGKPLIEVATIHFAKSKLAPDIIFHECLHACLSFARLKRLFPRKQITEHREERLCFALSDSGWKILNKLKKLRLV